jgi:hypothetical protein
MDRMEDPWIDQVVVVSLGFDSLRINPDHPVDDALTSSRRNECDHISGSYLFPLVGNHLELIPGPKGRVHGRPNIVYQSCSHVRLFL